MLSLINLVPKPGLFIQPYYPALYTNPSRPRLFHAMPFSKDWSDEAAETVRTTCQALGITYVRGDEPKTADIMHSIWEEICLANIILVDLTDFNANVTLELGMAHALGKKVILVGQPETEKQLFAHVEKLRVGVYEDFTQLGMFLTAYFK